MFVENQEHEAKVVIDPRAELLDIMIKFSDQQDTTKFVHFRFNLRENRMEHP